MTTRKKVVIHDDSPPTVEVSTRLLKWLGGLAGALLAIGGLVYAIGNWLDNHWMLATIANQREEKHQAEFKALSDKYDMQLLGLAKDAQRGRAWLTFSVADLKASMLEGRLDDCKEKPKADCSKQDIAHTRALNDADSLRKSAVEISK